MRRVKALKRGDMTFGIPKRVKARSSLGGRGAGLVRNSAALMRISTYRESKAVQSTHQAQWSSISDRNFTFLFKEESRCHTERKPGLFVQRLRREAGGPRASLRLRFLLSSDCEEFALRVTDVSMQERPTR